MTQFRPSIPCHSASKGSINNLVYTIRTITGNVTVFNTASLIDGIVCLLGTVFNKSNKSSIKNSINNFKLPLMQKIILKTPTGTPRRIDVESTWILRQFVEDQISTNFQASSTYFFDIISLSKNPRRFHVCSKFQVNFCSTYSTGHDDWWYGQTSVCVHVIVDRNF